MINKSSFQGKQLSLHSRFPTDFPKKSEEPSQSNWNVVRSVISNEAEEKQMISLWEWRVKAPVSILKVRSLTIEDRPFYPKKA